MLSAPVTPSRLRQVVSTAGVLFAVVILFSFTVAEGVYAQDTGTITPTPAPTKTPSTGVEEAATETIMATAVDEETPTRDAGIIQSLTQSDLQILTGNVQRPNGVVWHDDNLYAACTGDWTVYQLDDTNGQTITYIYGVRNAHTMFAEDDAAGELVLWIPDFQANALIRVTRNAVRPVAENLRGPWGVDAFDDESFLVTNLHANSVERVSRDGEIETVVSGLASPTGIVHEDGYIYVANNGSTRRAIEWYDASTSGAESDPQRQLLVSGLQNTTGMAMGSDGNLYFAYSLGTRGVVGRVDPVACRENGGCTHDQVEIVVLTELAAPLAGLTLSPDMRLYVHTMFSPDIYWVQLPS